MISQHDHKKLSKFFKNFHRWICFEEASTFLRKDKSVHNTKISYNCILLFPYYLYNIIKRKVFSVFFCDGVINYSGILLPHVEHNTYVFWSLFSQYIYFDRILGSSKIFGTHFHSKEFRFTLTSKELSPIAIISIM